MLTSRLLEGASSLLALTGVAALSHGRRWGWLVAALSSLGYVFFTWQLGLRGQMLLNGVYLVAQLAGWAGWGEGSFRRDRRAYAWLLAALPLGILMQTQMQPLDGWLTAVSLCAQGMTTMRYAEVWRCWLLIDLVSAYLYASRGAWFTCVLYGVFALVAESAHRHWARLAAGAERMTEKEPPYASQ